MKLPDNSTPDHLWTYYGCYPGYHANNLCLQRSAGIGSFLRFFRDAYLFLGNRRQADEYQTTAFR